MIFDESAVCTPVFCREVTGETPVLLPAAPFTVVLASSGRAAASADSEPVLLAAGGLFLAGGVAVEVTPVTGCHVLAAGFSGTAAQAAAAGLPAPLASDCSACPMAAQLLGELAAAMEKVRRASSPQTNGEEVRQLLEYMRQSNYRYRERFLLPYRDGYISVQVKDISHIALDERNTFLCLNNGTSETVPYSLDELESQLNPDVFFRANRQYLIHIDSILSINNWFNSRLKIRLKKYPDVEIIVSRERAAELKGWLDR